MKRLLALILVLVLAFSMGACTGKTEGESSLASTGYSSQEDNTTMNVFAIKGPSGVGMASQMKAFESEKTKGKYKFSVVASPDEVVAKILTGEADIAALSTNLAASLYSKTAGEIKTIAVSTLGVLSIIENGVSINSISDLKGQEIYTTGQGANPEYILKNILTKNGINPDTDVTLKFVGTNDELGTLLATGSAKIAMVPEPLATTVKLKNVNLRHALSITNEWSNVEENSELMMGCVIVRKKFLEEHPIAVNNFIEDYKASIKAVEDELDTVAALCEEYDIIPSAAIAKKAIEGCNITYISGEKMKTGLDNYYNILYNFNPQSVGGHIPNESFYYIP